MSREILVVPRSFSSDITSGRVWFLALTELHALPDSANDEISRVYNALASPYRRQIVQILRDKGKAGFKELHQLLGISVGALYHHLDMLEGIIAQTADKKYLLTDYGRSTIDTL